MTKPDPLSTDFGTQDHRHHHYFDDLRHVLLGVRHALPTNSPLGRALSKIVALCINVSVAGNNVDYCGCLLESLLESCRPTPRTVEIPWKTIIAGAYDLKLIFGTLHVMKHGGGTLQKNSIPSPTETSIISPGRRTFPLFDDATRTLNLHSCSP